MWSPRSVEEHEHRRGVLGRSDPAAFIYRLSVVPAMSSKYGKRLGYSLRHVWSVLRLIFQNGVSRLKSYAFVGIVAVVQIRLLKCNTCANLLYFKQQMMMGTCKSYIRWFFFKWIPVCWLAGERLKSVVRSEKQTSISVHSSYKTGLKVIYRVLTQMWVKFWDWLELSSWRSTISAVLNLKIFNFTHSLL